MTRGRLLSVLVVVVAACIGLFAGRAAAPTSSDAREAELSAKRAASREAFSPARQVAFTKALAEGEAAGAAEGARLGAEAGAAEAARVAEEAREAAAAKAAEAKRLAQQRSQQRVCGAPYFPDDYCPTRAELAQESLAERYCGRGDYAAARRAGIDCGVPGE